MRTQPRVQRSAFSLMEMMLALAIAMVLLLALYLTLSTQITHTKEGRDIVAEGALARNILTTIANDITGQLAIAPAPIPDATATAAAAASGTTAPAATDTSTVVTFNAGVQGDGTYITLATTRVQKPPPGTDPTSDVVNDKRPDQRRISYWVVTSGTEVSGLARYENKHATAADLDMLPTDLPEQGKYVIAKEVKSIEFEYYNGSGWQEPNSEWNGLTDLTGDGGLLGPPAAIKITITMRKTAAPDSEDGRRYTHIVAIPTGNNFPLPK